MIQRVQSLYLFISFLLSGVVSFFFPIWKNAKLQEVYALQEVKYVALFGISAILSLVSILLFKNRKSQFVINRLNIILNFILLGFFVYHSLNLSGDALVSEKGISMFIPLFSILLLVFANKAIKKDEDLVKSVNRLR